MTAEFDFGPGLRIEERIDAHEAEAITDRWEFGRWMLAHVPEGGDQLPSGFLSSLAAATGKSRRELQYRRQFAQRYATDEEVRNALHTFPSWHEIVNGALAKPRPTFDPVHPPEGTYSVLYADPPWSYEHNETPRLRAIEENHYPTSTTEEIAALDVPAADNAVLFLWGTAPKFTDAFEVVEAWGFEYRTNLVWVKDRIGTGYYVRGQHELLLIGKRGEGLVPAEGDRPPSVVHAPRTDHSAKPVEVYAVIERMYPDLPKIELFARNEREGWASWGNELAVAA